MRFSKQLLTFSILTFSIVILVYNLSITTTSRFPYYPKHYIPMANQFQIVGSKIFDDKGTEFVVKGANLLGLIYDKAKVYNTSEVNTIKNAWKFNLVRLPFRVKKQGTPYNEYKEFDANVKAFTEQGIVVLFDAHDTVGGVKDLAYYTSSSDPSLNQLAKMYKDLAVRYKDNPYVWFDLVNEPDWGKSDKNNWLTMHQTLIKTIRDDAQANNIILVEGWWYGQDSGAYDSTSMVSEDKSAILSLHKNILNFNNKAYSNIGFSMHTYDQWRLNAESKLADYIDKIIAKNLVLVVGEYGANNAGKSTLDASKALLNVGAKRNIGRIVWSYDASARNICTDGSGDKINKKDGSKPSNLTELGSLIWEDNRKVDKLAKLESKPTTTTPNPSKVSATPTTPGPSTVTPPSSKFNLIVEQVEVQQPLWRKNTPINFVAKVKNTGSDTIPSSWIGVLFYVNNTYTNWAGLTTSLSPGQSISISSPEFVPNSSTFELKALVDDHDVVKELKEDDNFLVVKLD